MGSSLLRLTPWHIVAAFAVVAGVCFSLPSRAQTAGPPIVAISITDSAFSPSALQIGAGQTVVWTNNGKNIHSVVSDTGVTPAFDSGGLNPGATFTVMFSAPGLVSYHSSTEPSYAYPTPVATPTGCVAACPVPAIVTYRLTGTLDVEVGVLAGGPCQFVLGFKVLHDLDPADVGDCTEFQSYDGNGNAVQHTTKGLIVWRKADNSTAFTNGYRTWVNGPYGLQQRLNTQQFAWEAGGKGPQIFQPTPGPASSEPTLVTNGVVTIDDSGGFHPTGIFIRAGGTVTWVNTGQQVHSVVNDDGNPPFNSGGLGPGQSYAYTFPDAGVHPYHSSVEIFPCQPAPICYFFHGSVIVK